MDENTEITDVQKKYGIRINVYAKQDVAVVEDNRNPSITNIYAYDQEKGSPTFCVTGEEATCVELKQAPETYEAGIIIKYKVNDTEEKYFHVMFDEGDTLTLQQRENIIYDTAWYNTNDDYVIDDNTNSFTCPTNIYTLEERIAKARMITIQEDHSLGCLGYVNSGLSNETCPVWMYNYLSNSVSNGGTINQANGEYGSNDGYWTLSANSSSELSERVWHIVFNGSVGISTPSLKYYGARAVVVIEKNKQN